MVRDCPVHLPNPLPQCRRLFGGRAIPVIQRLPSRLHDSLRFLHRLFNFIEHGKLLLN